MLLRRSLAYMGFSVICWVADRFACGLWTDLGAPYLHGVFHLFMSLGSYLGIVLLAYVNAKKSHPEAKAALKFWPVDSFNHGIAFVSC